MPGKALCFNPCFGGSYIVTETYKPLTSDGSAFQSLFWWILYCDLQSELYKSFVTMFQSLFWWILYCDNHKLITIAKNLNGFNPCFGGSYIVTLGVATPILRQGSFNPCFGGSYIVTIKGKIR